MEFVFRTKIIVAGIAQSLQWLRKNKKPAESIFYIYHAAIILFTTAHRPIEADARVYQRLFLWQYSGRDHSLPLLPQLRIHKSVTPPPYIFRVYCLNQQGDSFFTFQEYCIQGKQCLIKTPVKRFNRIGTNLYTTNMKGR